MIKLRYILFCTFRPLFMDFRGAVKIFSVKGGCQNLEIQGTPFIIRPPKKSGGFRPPTPVRAMDVTHEMVRVIW